MRQLAKGVYVAAAAAFLAPFGAAGGPRFGSRGSIFVSGDLEFSRDEVDVRATGEEMDTQFETDVSVAPMFGYFVVDGLAVVGGFGFGFHSERTSEAKTTFQTALLRGDVYYFVRPVEASPVYLYVGAGVRGIPGGSFEYDVTKDADDAYGDVSGFAFGGGGGVALADPGESGVFGRLGFSFISSSIKVELEGAPGASVTHDGNTYAAGTAVGIFF